METLESPIFDETMELCLDSGEPLSLAPDGQDLDGLAFQLWREGSQLGVNWPEDLDIE